MERELPEGETPVHSIEKIPWETLKVFFMFFLYILQHLKLVLNASTSSGLFKPIQFYLSDGGRGRRSKTFSCFMALLYQVYSVQFQNSLIFTYFQCIHTRVCLCHIAACRRACIVAGDMVVVLNVVTILLPFWYEAKFRFQLSAAKIHIST